MNLEFDLTNASFNTQFAPLGALSAHYQHTHMLTALENVALEMKIRDFAPSCKLKQVLVSILAGCETLTAFNTQMEGEAGLAAIWGWERFADQATLSRTLDALTLMNIDQLRTATTEIWVRSAKPASTIGADISCWTSIYRVCPARRGQKPAKKVISAVKKRDWTPIGPGQQCQIPRNGVVRVVSRQPAYRALFSTRSACGGKCFSVSS